MKMAVSRKLINNDRLSHKEFYMEEAGLNSESVYFTFDVVDRKKTFQ